MNNSGDFIKIEGLVKRFEMTQKLFQKKPPVVHAVNGISFSIKRGETLGLVGESGCGKTTTGKLVLRLLEPTSGNILINGKNLMELDKVELKSYRREAQIIFQDPWGSLNPRMKVEDVIGAGIAIQKTMNNENRREKVKQLMETVGLPFSDLLKYPHEFSGGQRQRIGIARALALDPQFIVCDEPVSALDVSIQAQIINLLEELQDTLGLTYLFISHDLSVVQHTSDRVAVMYLGKLVEIASNYELYKKPLHPYTEALLSAIPQPDPLRKSKRIILEGDVPTPTKIPEGCAFHTRCRYAMDICGKETPHLKEIEPAHEVSCWLHAK